MEISVLDVKFTDEEQGEINCYKECIGNIYDVNKSVIDTKTNDEIKVVGEETEEGFIIRFIDNSTKSLQNRSNDLHK